MEETFEDAVARIARTYAEGAPSFAPGSMASGSSTEHRTRGRWARDLALEAEQTAKYRDATDEGRAVLALIAADLRSRPFDATTGSSDVSVARNVTLVGPFEDGSYRLVVEGLEVPYLRVRGGSRTLGNFRGELDPSGWDVILDGRLLFHVPKDRAEQTFLLVANAMAVGAGWSCFGPNRTKLDPFGVKVAALSSSKPDAN